MYKKSTIHVSSLFFFFIRAPQSWNYPIKFLNNVKASVEGIKEIKKCEVELVWDPPWNQSMMSEEAQTMLGMELNRPMIDGTRAPQEVWE